MKKITFLLSFLFCIVQHVKAQINIGFESETWTNSQNLGSSISVNGIIFTYSGPNIIANVGGSSVIGTKGIAVNAGDGDSFEISYSDESEFDFISFYSYVSFTGNMTITGYKNSNQVAQLTGYTVQGNGTNNISSVDSGFQDVDRVVFSNANGGFGLYTGYDSFIFGDNVLSTQDLNLTKMSLYPNPTTDYITLNLKGIDDVEVSIYSVNGRRLKRIANYNSETTINIKNLSDGLYFLKIKSSNKSVLKKFMKI